MSDKNPFNDHVKLDTLYRSVDRKRIRRTRNLRLIPGYQNRRGGKISYAEWAHVIGIFQTLIYQNLYKKTGVKLLDIGCGTGLLGISSEPFVSEGGSYTGIDIMKRDIEFCKSNYPFENYHFIHHNVGNPTYAKEQPSTQKIWPIKNNSYDMVTALSVWTHLREKDAIFYVKEIERVLVKGGKAIITCFYLNKDYIASLNKRSAGQGRYNMTKQDNWIFDTSAYGSKNWFTTARTKDPEDAIAITDQGFDKMLAGTSLKLIEYNVGSWKERPGIYFQDVLILEKT